MSKRKMKLVAVFVLVAIALSGWMLLLLRMKRDEQGQIHDDVSDSKVQQGSNVVNDEAFDVVIMVPKDYVSYERKIAKSLQEGDEDVVSSINFVKKTVNVPKMEDVIKASAQAAAQEVAPGGGPEILVESVKVQGDTAYVTLNIDQDGSGWAGVSLTQALVHPIIEQTLLQFPQIKKVIFEPSSQANESARQDDIEWVEFTAGGDKYTISYPADWKLTEKTVGPDSVILEISNGDYSVLYNPPKALTENCIYPDTDEKMLKLVLEGYFPDKKAFQDYYNYSTIRFDDYVEFGDYRRAVHDGQIYICNGNSGPDSVGFMNTGFQYKVPDNPDENMLKIMDKIVETFRWGG